jgi:hypothetical protein
MEGGQSVASTKHRQELALVLLNEAGATEFLQFAERVGVERWPEAEIDELSEASPWHVAILTLEGVVPLGGDAVHMQGCHPDLLDCQCPRAPEVRLTTVEPWKRIGLTVVVRKVDLGPVEGLAEVVTVVAGWRWGLVEGAGTVNDATDCTDVLGR